MILTKYFLKSRNVPYIGSNTISSEVYKNESKNIIQEHVVGANGTEAGGSSYRVPETGEEVGGEKAEGRLVSEGGDGQSASGSGDTTTSDLLGQEAGGSGRMGGLTAYL